MSEITNNEASVNEAQEANKPGIEEGISRLEDILRDMEEPDIELVRSFSLFEEGMRLLKDVNEQIDAVEKKVYILSEDKNLREFEE